jgi:uncharacterized protein (TIGR03083 family)
MVETLSVFPTLNARLMELVTSIKPEEWTRPTAYPQWQVKDIVAHLIDTAIRRLSVQRDGWDAGTTRPLRSEPELIARITSMADRWADAFVPVSPAILVSLVDTWQRQLVDFLRKLPPEGIAPNPVTWAGETTSPNWFDIAREYTERWHHQMQIREALGREDILDEPLYGPVLDTFALAFPWHFSTLARKPGYICRIEIDGLPDNSWNLEWNKHGISLLRNTQNPWHSRIRIPPSTAWKVFTRSSRVSLAPSIRLEGNPEDLDHLLTLKCVMI